MDYSTSLLRNKAASALALLILFACPVQSLAGQVDLSEYDVYFGDFNEDGSDNDVYFHGKDKLILLHGDIITPVETPGPDGFVYYEGGDGRSSSLTLDESQLDQYHLAKVDTDYTVLDENGDGTFDLFKYLQGDSEKTLALTSPAYGDSPGASLAETGNLSGPPNQPSSDNVGAIDGSFRVNEAGAATYTIPLKLPQGTASVKPQLAFAYSSQAGNGLMGKGWSLEGLSAISRCRQTLNQDGEAKPITWSGEDRFCLNGQRLILESGSSYGAIGSTYKTEVDRHIIVRSRGGSYGHPSYFEVKAKDGSVTTYGRTPDSKLSLAPGTLTWAQSGFEDSVGNRIVYRYVGSELSGFRIDRIDYAFPATNSSSEPRAYVEFNYESNGRPDNSVKYVGGERIEENQRLSEVIVYNKKSVGVGGVEYRRYKLNFQGEDAVPTDKISRLASIEECIDQYNCVYVTDFAWPDVKLVRDFDSNPDEYSRRMFIGEIGDFINLGNNVGVLGFQYLDINGDANIDLAWIEFDQVYHEGQQLRYSLSDGEGNFSNPVDVQGGSYGADLTVPGPRIETYVVDYNADGRQDLITREPRNEYGDIWKLYRAMPDANSGWYLKRDASVELPFPNRRLSFADVNGDGLADAYYYDEDGVRVHYAIKSGEPVTSDRYYKYSDNHTYYAFEGLPSLANNEERRFYSFSMNSAPDFNGDGKADFVAEMDIIEVTYTTTIDPINGGTMEVRREKPQGKRYASFELEGNKAKLLGFLSKPKTGGTLKVADINGDGLTDVLAKNSGQWVYKLSTGTGLTESKNILGLPTSVEADKLHLIDINKDGYKDLVHADDNTGLFLYEWLPKKEGESFSSVGKRLSKYYFVHDDGMASIFDINGDGWEDFLVFTRNSSGEYFWRSILSSHDGELAPNVITEVSDDFGTNLSLSYEPLTKSDNYTRIDVDEPTVTPQEVCFDREVNGYGGPSFTYETCYESTKVVVSTTEFYRSINDPFHDLPSGNDRYPAFQNQPVLEMNAPLPVVTAVSKRSPTLNDPQAKAKYSYFYEQMKFQAAGRGALGFKKLSSVDHQKGLITETTYRQDWPFIGSPLKTVTKSANGKILKSAENYWSHAARGTSAKYHQIHAARVVEKHYDLSNNGSSQGSLLKTVETTTEKDAYGNATSIKVTTSGNGETHSQVTNNIYEAGSLKELGRLMSTEVTTTFNGKQSVREVRFEYVTNGAHAGLLKKEIVAPNNTSLKTTKENHYDSYGNKTYTRTVGADGTVRKSDETTYKNGRYLVREKNALGHVKSEVLDRDSYGRPTRVRDVSGVTTAVSYDELGRKYLSVDGTGSWSWSGSFWCGSGEHNCPATAAYFVETKASGGSTSRVYYDALKRKVRESARGFDGRWVHTDTRYDKRGYAVRVSTPFFNGESADGWATTHYDLLGRVTKLQQPGQDVAENRDYQRYLTEVTNVLGQLRKEERNIVGELVEVTDNLGGKVHYEYDLHGNLTKAVTTAPDVDSVTVRICYDALGRKVAMHDPDKGGFAGNAGISCEQVNLNNPQAGWWTYQYNAVGELEKQIDAKGQATLFSYDLLGRKVTRTDKKPGGAIEAYTRWRYDGDQSGQPYGPEVGKLTSVVQSEGQTNDSCGANSFCKYHLYDEYGRNTDTMTFHPQDDAAYITSTAYDSIGRPYITRDALQGLVMADSGTVNQYNHYGYRRTTLDLASGDILHKVIAMNARGQITEEERGGSGNIVGTYDYDPMLGQLRHQVAYSNTSGSALPLQEINYKWDEAGNLKSRHNQSALKGGNSTKDLQESFCYDGLNRLIKSHQGTLNGGCSLSLSAMDVRYDGLGNITFKSDVGEYLYGSNAGPHAVTSAGGMTYRYDANGNQKSGDGRTLEYSTFDKPTRIVKNGHVTNLKYGPDRSRYQRTDQKDSGPIKVTKYIGNVERIQVHGGNEITWRRMVAGAVYKVTTDASFQIKQPVEKAFIFKDHLGSTDVITDASGNIKQSMSFNAWGQRRNERDWDAILNDSQLLLFNTDVTNAGFTGHEQMDEVGLIHMNGRVYDPKLGRFLQADPFIQAATNTQSYNRYSYVLNNPLNATDPSGYFFDSIGDFFKSVIGVIVTVAVNIACGGCMVFAGMIGGATSAAVNGGNIIKGAVFGAFGAGMYQAGGWMASAAWGGAAAEMSGGSFTNGFLSAGVSSYFGGMQFKNGFERFLVATVSGGASSKMSGGKFENGAATGAFAWAASNVADSLSKGRSCKSPCSGEVTIDKSQLETTEDYELVQDHLESLKGDRYVNQSSLASASIDISVGLAMSRFLTTSQADITQSVFEYRYRQSQRDVANLTGRLMLAPFVVARPIASISVYGNATFGLSVVDLYNKPNAVNGFQAGAGLSREVLTRAANNHPAAVIVNTAVSDIIGRFPDE